MSRDMGITKELADYGYKLRFHRLPEEVVDRVKYLFLDFIGVAWRGSREGSSQSVYRFVREMPRDGPLGVIIGTKERVPYVYASLANGTSAHAVEMDDVNNEASLHPGVVVFSSALATGEMAGTSGRRFIEAVVLGYEVMVRLGRALGPEAHYRRGFHPTATCGVFGSSMAASKVMGLKAEGMASALGISGSQAAGSMEFLAEGAWTKRFHAGWAAHSGILAAQLARHGFKGPRTIVEGRDGFLHAYSDRSDETRILEKLGSRFEILRTSVKPHSCCRYMQPPIDGILALVRDHDIRPDEVEGVRLGILRAGSRLIAEPRKAKYNPQTVVDAQFSMPFGAAVALLYRKAALNEFHPSKIDSDDVRQMMGRVEYVEDPELERAYPQHWGATVEILARGGKRYFIKVETPKGDPENPLSWEELIEKFTDLTGRLMTKERRLKIVEQAKGLERIRNIRDLSPLLVHPR
jgi:2-methylcitrate dehydratase PrpD